MKIEKAIHRSYVTHWWDCGLRSHKEKHKDEYDAQWCIDHRPLGTTFQKRTHTELSRIVAHVDAGLTFKRVGEIHGLSGSRVSQIVKKYRREAKDRMEQRAIGARLE